MLNLHFLLEPSAASQASAFIELNVEASVCVYYVCGLKRFLEMKHKLKPKLKRSGIVIYSHI